MGGGDGIAWSSQQYKQLDFDVDLFAFLGMLQQGGCGHMYVKFYVGPSHCYSKIDECFPTFPNTEVFNSEDYCFLVPGGLFKLKVVFVLCSDDFS